MRMFSVACRHTVQRSPAGAAAGREGWAGGCEAELWPVPPGSAGRRPLLCACCRGRTCHTNGAWGDGSSETPLAARLGYAGHG